MAKQSYRKHSSNREQASQLRNLAPICKCTSHEAQMDLCGLGMGNLKESAWKLCAAIRTQYVSRLNGILQETVRILYGNLPASSRDPRGFL